MDSLAKDLLRQHAQLVTQRSVLDEHLQEIAERILPSHANFQQSKLQEGEKRHEKVFDSTAEQALIQFTAAIEWLVTPRNEIWHTVRTTSDALNEDYDVKGYLDRVTKKLFAARYSSRANFASQNNERFMSLGAFGTGPLYVDWEEGLGLRYKSMDLANTHLAENHQGIIDTVYRRFEYTARQAVQRWDKARLPGSIIEASEGPRQHDKFAFLHVVKPNPKMDSERQDHEGMQWSSYYLHVDSKTIVDEGGYRSWPFSIGRYATAPCGVYGIGPAMLALADVKMLNEMSRSVIRQAHRTLDPPLLLPDDGVIGVDLRPSAENYGGINANGQSLIKPLITGARLDLSNETIVDKRSAIKEAFLVEIFQAIVDNPQMTATQVMEIAQQKASMLGPTVGRQQSEALGPQIEREIDLMDERGLFGQVPQALVEADGEYEIYYDSPLTRAQQSGKVVSINRWLENTLPLAQLQPEILDNVDGDEIMRIIGDSSGVPNKVIRPRDAVAEMREQRAEQQQAAEAMNAAQPMAAAVKDVAQAEAMAGA